MFVKYENLLNDLSKKFYNILSIIIKLMTFLKAFTTQINNLIIELYEVLPYNKDISVNKTAIELLIKTNPRMVLNAFNTYVLPYKTKIIERDDTFFISQKIQPSDTINRQIIKTLQILRDSWSKLTVNTQNNVWLYFTVLIRLSEKISLAEKNAV